MALAVPLLTYFGC